MHVKHFSTQFVYEQLVESFLYLKILVFLKSLLMLLPLYLANWYFSNSKKVLNFPNYFLIKILEVVLSIKEIWDIIVVENILKTDQKKHYLRLLYFFWVFWRLSRYFFIYLFLILYGLEVYSKFSFSSFKLSDFRHSFLSTLVHATHLTLINN